MSKKIELMCHLVAGYPNWETFENLCYCLAENGANYLEIQLPFSDPMADGPTIMQANAKVLQQGYSLDQALISLEKVIQKIQIPVYVMSYLNVFYQQDTAVFAKDLNDIGVQGCIIPDLSFEANQKEDLKSQIEKAGLNFVAVLAPNQDRARLENIESFVSNMVYLPSRTGVTGTHTSFSETLFDQIALIKESLPVEKIAVGFGISSREQIDAVSNFADIAVVGSAILKAINTNPIHPLKAVEAFMRRFNID